MIRGLSRRTNAVRREIKQTASISFLTCAIVYWKLEDVKVTARYIYAFVYPSVFLNDLFFWIKSMD